MVTEPITVYKLMILYMLSRAESPLSQDIMYNYITERGYTNYFNVQNAIGELLQTELIKEKKTYHLVYYTILDAGKKTLELFGHQLSHNIRKEIDDYLNTNKISIVNSTSLLSDYTLTSDKNYIASCVLKEGEDTLFHIELEVPSEKDAVKICDNWRKNGIAEDLYRNAVKTLLKND